MSQRCIKITPASIKKVSAAIKRTGPWPGEGVYYAHVPMYVTRRGEIVANPQPKAPKPKKAGKPEKQEVFHQYAAGRISSRRIIEEQEYGSASFAGTMGRSPFRNHSIDQ